MALVDGQPQLRLELPMSKGNVAVWLAVVSRTPWLKCSSAREIFSQTVEIHGEKVNFVSIGSDRIWSREGVRKKKKTADEVLSDMTMEVLHRWTGAAQCNSTW